LILLTTHKWAVITIFRSGESIIGVVISAIVVFSGKNAPLSLVGPSFETPAIIIGGLAFAATAFVLYRWVLRMTTARAT
jgi:hypothetical protein